MDDIAFTTRFTPESFGGEKFWANLIKLGMVKETCPLCGKEGPVRKYKSKTMSLS